MSESEKHYRMLFNAIDEGFCIVEVIFDENEKPIDYRFIETNPAFEKQTGLIGAQGKRMRALAPKHEAYWFEIYGEIALTGQPARFVNRAEQLHRWYDVYAFRFGQPENRQVAVLFNDITERKRVEAALQKSEERLRLSLIGSGVCFWEWFPESGRIHFDGNWARILGYDSGEKDFNFEWWNESLHPDSKPVFERALNDYLEGRKSRYELEYQIQTKTGDWKWIWAAGECVEWDKNRKFVRFLGTHRDITKSKQAEEQKSEQERLNQILLDSLPCVALLMRPKTREIVAMNKVAKEAGCSLGHTCFGTWPKFEQPCPWCLAPKLWTEGQAQQKEVEALGVVWDAHWDPISDDLYLHYAFDITERKRLEQELKHINTLLEKVYSSLEEAVFVIDPQTRIIISCNTAAETIFGYRKEEMHGRNTEFIYFNKKTYCEYGKKLTHAIATEGVFHAEFSLRKKDGTVFPVEYTAKEVRGNSGQPTLHVVVVRDITRQSEATKKLQNNEKELKAKSERLEELNAALKVLLDQREKEKTSIEENLSESINGLIIPYLNRIRKTGLNGLQEGYIEILESNLIEIMKPYMHRISGKLMHLSPTETRIANLVRQGYRIKEIALQLNISPRTVEFHRDNIRKKLSLKGRRVNLKTYLSKIS